MSLRLRHNFNFGKLNNYVDALPEEAQLQAICVKYAQIHYPHLLLIHCPNTSSSKQTSAKLMGLKAGFPDILLIDEFANHYYCEFKSEKGIISEAQKAMHLDLEEKGLEVQIIRKFGEWQVFLYKNFVYKNI